jgi:hypothetical protein
MIAQSFYTFVSGRAGITALTGSIYPIMLPQSHDGFPAITYSMDDDADQPLVDGTVSGMREALFSVDCWGLTGVSVQSLASAVKTELIGYIGTMGAHTVNRCRKEREDFNFYESDTGLFRVNLQFLVAYE